MAKRRKKKRGTGHAGPQSWGTSIGKGTNAWSSTRRRRMGSSKRRRQQ